MSIVSLYCPQEIHQHDTTKRHWFILYQVRLTPPVFKRDSSVTTHLSYLVITGDCPTVVDYVVAVDAEIADGPEVGESVGPEKGDVSELRCDHNASKLKLKRPTPRERRGFAWIVRAGRG